MKTGRDANQPGQYRSECCFAEVSLIKGQMFPRCPACYALTVWDFMKRKPDNRFDAKSALPRP
jgi:hypothetical protein